MEASSDSASAAQLLSLPTRFFTALARMLGTGSEEDSRAISAYTILQQLEKTKDATLSTLFAAKDAVVKSSVYEAVSIFLVLLNEIQARFGLGKTARILSLNPSASLRALIAYSICQKVARDQRRFTESFVHRDILASSTPDDLELMQQIAYYARFTTGSYGVMMQALRRLHQIRAPPTDHKSTIFFGKGPKDKRMTNHADFQSLIQYAKVNADDIIHSGESNDFFNPLHYVIIDRKNKVVLLLIRGTATIHDLMTDLCCKSVDFYIGGIRGQVHEGMLKSAQKLGSELIDIIDKALQMHAGYRLKIVGHSLGAAVASLITMSWYNRFPDIQCLAFGCPCVMSYELSVYSRKYVTSIIRGYDFVSRLSLGSVLDLLTAINYFALNAGLSEAIILGSIGTHKSIGLRDYGAFTRQCESNLKQCRKRMKEEKLYPVGRILWMTKESFETAPESNVQIGKRGEKLRVWEVDAQLFHEIVFSKNMFQHHLPYVYERALYRIEREKGDAGSASGTGFEEGRVASKL